MMNCNCENMLYQFGNNIRSQRQGEVGVGGDGYSSHDSLANNNNDDDDNHNCRQQHQINPSCSKTTSNFSMSEVAELTWEHGQLAMHGLSGLLPSTSTKPTAWMGPNDTLESIIHYATYPQQILMTPIDAGIDHEQPKTRENMTSVVASSGGAWSETSGKKRTRADSDQCGGKFGGGTVEERGDRSACGSASVTFCRDNDTTMMTWASYESPMSLKAKNTNEDSACHGGSENQDENLETKTETNRSHSSSRRTRATAIHNQSERRRRDRINQKMKALQKLVPNANKTDKASMLDEVIEYLKQLQAQVHMMNNVMNISPNMNMMMPLSLGMHHHHHHQQQQQLQQLSMLARMHGMSLVTGMATAAGMGMLSDINTTTAMSIARGSSNDGPNPLIHPSMVAAAAAAATSPVNPSTGHFMGPSTPPTNNSPADVSAPSGPLPADPYYAFLTQSMNLDLYNKLATIYRQPISQTPPATSGPSTATSSHG